MISIEDMTSQSKLMLKIILSYYHSCHIIHVYIYTHNVNILYYDVYVVFNDIYI